MENIFSSLPISLGSGLKSNNMLLKEFLLKKFTLSERRRMAEKITVPVEFRLSWNKVKRAYLDYRFYLPANQVDEQYKKILKEATLHANILLIDFLSSPR